MQIKEIIRGVWHFGDMNFDCRVHIGDKVRVTTPRTSFEGTWDEIRCSKQEECIIVIDSKHRYLKIPFEMVEKMEKIKA